MFKKFLTLLFSLLMASSLFAKSGNAKQGYFFFEGATAWTCEDELVKVTVLIDPNCDSSKSFFNGYYLFNMPYVVVTIENKSFDIVYIDLAQSFLSRNKRAQMFWDNSQKVNSSGSTVGATVNMGALAGAAGIGGVLGTLANGVSIGGSSTSTTATITQAERILRIPPMSEEKINIPIYSDLLNRNFKIEKTRALPWPGEYLCYKNPKIQVKESRKFTIDDTPLSLVVYITYSETEDVKEKQHASIIFFAQELIGCKEMIGGKKSYPEMEIYGYDISAPHIMVKFED